MISVRIKEARARKGYTQNDLAAAIGVAKITVAKWETGAMLPGGKNLMKLASALNVSPEFLSGREELEKKESLPKIELMQPEEFYPITHKHTSNIKVLGVIVAHM